MSNDKNFRNLVKLIKLFKNRPHHLAKWLITNLAFNDMFLKLLAESNKLDDLQDTDTPNFKTIEEMNDYYNIFDENYKSKKISPEKLYNELLLKLEDCIKLEKYEEAGRIRDYMIKLGLKKN